MPPGIGPPPGATRTGPRRLTARTCLPATGRGKVGPTPAGGWARASGARALHYGAGGSCGPRPTGPRPDSTSPYACMRSGNRSVDRSFRSGTARIPRQPQIPVRAALLVQRAQEPAVAQLVDPALVHHMPGDGAQLVQRLLVPDVAVLGGEHLADGGEFQRTVAGEVDAGGEAGGQSRVGGEEAVHALGIAGQDDDQMVAVVLSALQQDLQSLVAVGVALAVAGVGERCTPRRRRAPRPARSRSARWP